MATQRSSAARMLVQGAMLLRQPPADAGRRRLLRWAGRQGCCLCKLPAWARRCANADPCCSAVKVVGRQGRKRTSVGCAASAAPSAARLHLHTLNNCVPLLRPYWCRSWLAFTSSSSTCQAREFKGAPGGAVALVGGRHAHWQEAWADTLLLPVTGCKSLSACPLMLLLGPPPLDHC